MHLNCSNYQAIFLTYQGGLSEFFFFGGGRSWVLNFHFGINVRPEGPQMGA